ncbi:MAG: DUF2914 domain-containing protein [Desulfatitalea sp.]
MKGRLLGILLVCLILAWAAVPALSDEQTQPTAPEATATRVEQKNVDPAPPAAPAAAPAAAVSTVPAGMEIKDAVVCQDVVDRAPSGGGDVFSKDLSKVYCFCRVVGVTDESSITQNWYYKGALKSSIQLPVRSANWRTWSAKNLSPEWTGEWMVEILSENGTPLESIIFMVQ